MLNTIQTIEAGKQCFYYEQPFNFALGGQLSGLQVVFETYGQLNAAKDNAILIHHALSTHSHVASHPADETPGWWEGMVGPGCAFDTEQYFIICCNNIGSCFGSSGPSSINPQTGEAYRLHFPALSIDDIMRSQCLVLDALGIDKLHAVVGPSMGAMMSLAMASTYPLRVNKLVSISSCYKTYPANDAVHAIQRDMIRLDPLWQQGHYTHRELPGFVLARKFGHLSYRNKDELNARFENLSDGRTIHSYLDYNAKKFTAQFDANSYIYLTEAMDNFDLTKGADNPLDVFAKIKAQSLVISVPSDNLFPPYQQRALYQCLQQAGCDARFVTYESTYGHDTFLVETTGIGQILREFIA